MSTNPVLADAINRIGGERLRLAATGALLIVGGLAAMFAPHYAGELVVRLLGVVLWCAAIAMAVNWVLGWCHEGRHRRGGFLFLGQLLLIVLAANALLFETVYPARFLRIALGVLFILDAATQVVIALQTDRWTGKLLLLLSAFVTAIAGLLAIFLVTDASGGELLSVLLGVRLTVFGGVLMWMAWTTTRESAYVYGLRPERSVEPIPGECYAVFIGNSFHLGVYVGENEVVDYRDDNLVHLVTWEQFLLGREPEHWQYPDLPAVPPEEVCRVARESVGRTYPYKFFEFNCESFAVWCKSGGTTHHSDYAQVALAFGNVGVHPVVGTLLEFYARVVETLAFHLGGTFGKRTALAIRRTAAAISKTLLARRLDPTKTTSIPARARPATTDVADPPEVA